MGKPSTGKASLSVLVVLLLFTLVLTGCPQNKETKKPDITVAKVKHSEKPAGAYGADPTQFNPNRPIRGRIVSLDDARKLSLLPVAGPKSLPDGVTLQQVRVDNGTVDNPTTRVHMIYAKSKKGLPEPKYKGNLWDGTPVEYDGGISFADLLRLESPVILVLELAPRKPLASGKTNVKVAGAPAAFTAGAPGSRPALSRLEWWRGGISYHLFAGAPKDRILTIAESVPRPAHPLPVLEGEFPISGKEITLKEARKHPLFSALKPDEPRLTPTRSSLRKIVATYSPEEKISTLYLLYSTKPLAAVREDIRMSDGSTIPVVNGPTFQGLARVPGGLIVMFRTEPKPPVPAPGIPAVVGKDTNAYYKDSYLAPGSKRLYPREIRWHQQGTAVRVFAFLQRPFLVQVGSSFPSVGQKL